MFEFIRNWIIRRRNQRESLFWFWDGHRLRKADPLDTYMRLHSDPDYSPGVLHDQLALNDSRGIETAMAVVCRIFGVQKWTEARGGVTAAEAIAILYAFDAYCEAVSKKNGSNLTSPASTAPPPLERSTGKPDSDLCSTVNGRVGAQQVA